MSDTQLDWTTFTPGVLPSWMGIARLVSRFDVSYLHSAVVVCFNIDLNTSNERQPAEAIVYTPHGIGSDNYSLLSHAQPPIQPLALIHGLHEVSVCGLGHINLGAVNGLESQRMTGAKYCMFFSWSHSSSPLQ